MPPILSKPPYQFNIFLDSLRTPWKRSTLLNEDLSVTSNEADLIIRSISAELKRNLRNNIDDLPNVIRTITLSEIASPIFHEDSEKLAINRLQAIRKLLPVHIQVSKRIQKVIRDEKFSNAKIHSQIKENGDFEIIILADPSEDGPYFLMELLFKNIEEYLETKKRQALKIKGITVSYHLEENEERAFIEMTNKSSKIIIRDLSSQGYLEHFDSEKPFDVLGESSSFRSKFLTDQLIFSRLQGGEEDFPQDIYPFIVRCFLRITKTNRLLDLSGLSKLQQIEEEHHLLNQFFCFLREPQNLFKILHEAQTSLIGFGDYDCVQKNRDGDYSVYEYSPSAKICKNLVAALRQQIVPEEIRHAASADDDFCDEEQQIVPEEIRHAASADDDFCDEEGTKCLQEESACSSPC